MNLFMYIRLSQADSNLKFRSESESIANQRILLRRYIDTHPDLAVCSVEEFVDDGYSGTNADRPSFEQMIECIKTVKLRLLSARTSAVFSEIMLRSATILKEYFRFWECGLSL